MLARALPIAVILLAGCARSEDASITVDMNRMAPDIVSNSNAEEEIAAGLWREAVQDNSQALEFAAEGAAPLFSLRCAAGGGLVLQRHGAQGGSAMAVSVGRERREIPATADTPGLVRATLPAGDSLIAALGAAATPIGIRLTGAVPLLLPPGPPVSAFVSRCTTGASVGAAPAANSASPAANGTAPAVNAAAPAPAGNSTR